MKLPAIYSRWVSKNNPMVFTVLMVTNINNTEDYPTTICFLSEKGALFSTPIKDFLERFRQIDVIKKTRNEVSDLKILKVLLINDGKSIRFLAEKAGLSPTGLVKRLKKLEELRRVKQDYGRWILTEETREKLTESTK